MVHQGFELVVIVHLHLYDPSILIRAFINLKFWKNIVILNDEKELENEKITRENQHHAIWC